METARKPAGYANFRLYDVYRGMNKGKEGLHINTKKSGLDFRVSFEYENVHLAVPRALSLILIKSHLLLLVNCKKLKSVVVSPHHVTYDREKKPNGLRVRSANRV
jgi:hypothetical protein